MPDLPDELRHLDLEPHPEGGFFRERWRSAYCTHIDFVLLAGTFSAWHRVVGADEVWSHHTGGRLALHLLSEAGERDRVEIGDTRRSAVVPAGWWQAAEPLDDAWVWVGCTVSPPFAFSRFELADPSLADRYPEHASQLRQWIRI